MSKIGDTVACAKCGKKITLTDSLDSSRDECSCGASFRSMFPDAYGYSEQDLAQARKSADSRGHPLLSILLYILGAGGMLGGLFVGLQPLATFEYGQDRALMASISVSYLISGVGAGLVVIGLGRVIDLLDAIRWNTRPASAPSD